MNIAVEIARGSVEAPSVYGFVTSPGAAGALAVIAAVIAFAAATSTAKRDRWWKRAEYALDLTQSEDVRFQLVGLTMLGTLRTRRVEEADFIKAATDVFLDPDVDGDETDDFPTEVDGPRTPDSFTDPPASRLGLGERVMGAVGGFIRWIRRQSKRGRGDHEH